jgi:hypothetical protein
LESVKPPSDRTSDNSTISSFNDSETAAPVLQFDPEQSTALQINLKDLFPHESARSLKSNAQGKQKRIQQPSISQGSALSSMDSDSEDDLHNPFENLDRAAKDDLSVWDDDDLKNTATNLYPSEDGYVAPEKVDTTVRSPSGGDDCSSKHAYGNESDFSFSQIIVDSFHDRSFGFEGGDEELSNRKAQNHRQRKNKGKKKTARATSSRTQNSTNQWDERNRQNGANQILQEVSVPTSFLNDQLSYETETDDESAAGYALKPLSVTVSNTVTPYESEVDSTPRRTPLKKRLGFSMYFRGKMKSSPLDRSPAPDDVLDSEASVSNSFNKRGTFRREAGHSRLLESSCSENGSLFKESN